MSKKEVDNIANEVLKKFQKEETPLIKIPTLQDDDSLIKYDPKNKTLTIKKKEDK